MSSTETSVVDAEGRSDLPIDVRGVRVTYGSGDAAVEAISDVTFAIEPGEFVCIVGPSGCGKTTLLKALSGLLTPTAGAIHVSGRKVNGPPRELALVFQDYTRSLLPWLSIEHNVALPLKAMGVKSAERRERALRALDDVGLAGFEKKYPWQLSGGMQQRVAIARAIAYNPTVLLMDEPFASVDAYTRAELEDLLLRLQRETKMTVVLVTHDIDESVYLASRVLVLSRRPTRVRHTAEVSLPEPRDQVTTKAEPEFIRLRTEISRLIQHQNDPQATGSAS